MTRLALSLSAQAAPEIAAPRPILRKWKQMIRSLPSWLALFGVAALALFPDARTLNSPNMASDRLALWFLFLSALVLQIPAVMRRLRDSRDGALWAVLCAMFVLFQIAERAGPRNGFSLHFGWAPDDPVVVSWATRLVVIGAILSVSQWIRRAGAERFVWLGLGLVALFGIGMFRLLGDHFSVGATDTLNPGPMVSLVAQIAGYGALALCGRAAVEDERSRAFVLRALPIILLLVAARHQFAPIHAPVVSD